MRAEFLTECERLTCYRCGFDEMLADPEQDTFYRDREGRIVCDMCKDAIAALLR